MQGVFVGGSDDESARPVRHRMIEVDGVQGAYAGGSSDDEMPTAAKGKEKRRRESSSKGKGAAGCGKGLKTSETAHSKRQQAGTSRSAVREGGDQQAEGSAGSRGP